MKKYTPQKCTRVSARAMKKLVEEPGDKEIYRQTRNWKLNRWACPKILQSNGVWRLIRHRDKVINKKTGSGYAIWRIQYLKSGVTIRGTDNKIWDCQLYTVLTRPYSLYYLICRRISHDFSGAN